MLNRIHKIKNLLLIAGTLLFFQACSTIKPTPFQAGETLNAPSGVVDLINNRPAKLAEFNVGNNQNNETIAEGELVFVLQEVLEELLDKFEFVDDYEQFKKSEYWAAPSENTYRDSFGNEYLAGDCDEFSMHVLMELKKRGIKARIVTALTEENKAHTVVESNGWIVDNRYPYVVANNELDYKWLTISDYDLKDNWYAALKMDDADSKTLIASAKR